MSPQYLISLVISIVLTLVFLTGEDFSAQSVENARDVILTVVGQVTDTQGNPVDEAEVQILLGEVPQTLLVASQPREFVLSDEEGFYVAELVLFRAQIESETLAIQVSKPAFRTQRDDLRHEDMAQHEDHYFVGVLNVVLPHVVNPAFFIATITLVAVFALIGFHVLHDTAAAFLGAAIIFGVSYLVGTHNRDFWIFGFEKAVEFIDWDVIFLVMSLMIVVSIIGRTGMFQWLALAAYRAAHGSAWRLAVILMAATAILSAFLNNVTIMLLMAPITIEIALILGVNPAAFIVAEALAAEIGGAGTLIGDPPNTVIGSYADIGFNEFLAHMGPIAVLATLTLIGVVYVIYRRDLRGTRQMASDALLARLEKDARISDPKTLRRGLLVLGMMLILFFTGEAFEMPPSVVGIIGAAALLVWTRPDMDEMLSEVDWTTLMFFICLFIVVGAVQEVGLIQYIADLIADTAGENLLIASLVIIGLSGLASAIVNNIPFTTAVLPIAAFLTRTIPGAGNNVLYWSLSLGANMGGNATYIGSAPNVVAVGVLDRAGYHMTFADWLRVGIPVTVATVLVPTLWILIRYFWLGF